MNVGVLQWEALSAIARAHLAVGDASRTRESLQEALTIVEEARSRRRQISGEDSLLESETALVVLKDWVRLIRTMEGEQASRNAAEAAEWPPLVDWLNRIVETKGPVLS